MSACAKRCYGSVNAARAAHRHAHYRIRVYWCRLCRAFHATSQEKRTTGRWSDLRNES